MFLPSWLERPSASELGSPRLNCAPTTVVQWLISISVKPVQLILVTLFVGFPAFLEQLILCFLERRVCFDSSEVDIREGTFV